MAAQADFPAGGGQVAVAKTVPVSRSESEFVAYAVELLQGVGPAASKRMFGGHGIFIEGLMFALVADGTLYLKADDASRDAFESRGLERFTYEKRGKTFAMSYYQAPEEALESYDEMTTWGNRAFDAALRGATKTRR